MSNAFERGVRAKRRGRSESSNPFVKRAGRSNAKKANDWLLGWHSVESQGSTEAFQWPALARLPRPLEGDYGVRMRGLEALFRVPAGMVVEWGILRQEMKLGVARDVPEWATVGYTILWWYSGGEIGEEYSGGDQVGHPMKYLSSGLRIQKGASRWPNLVRTAYEELRN